MIRLGLGRPVPAMTAELATNRPRVHALESVGRYRLLTELGTGATARVWLARAEGVGGFHRLFAVKMIHEHLSGETKFVDLFLNEARIASRIHHPNVVAISDVGLEASSYYLSMDYVGGETLTRLLQATWNEGRPLPIDITLQILLQCCEGLHAAHELKDRDGRPLSVVHRDVAPQNVMVGYDGVVRLMDFGIAKAVDQLKTTRPGVWRGTLPYMAPEQIRAQGALDRRVDLFALGIVLWESTVGQRLFKAKRDLDTLTRVLELEVPRPSSVTDGYPEALEAIVLKALERDPERRYQSARALGDDLRDVLDARGVRMAAAPVERLMKSVFAERFEHRSALERLALTGAPREEIEAFLADRESLGLAGRPPVPVAPPAGPPVEEDTLEVPEIERPDEAATVLREALRRPSARADTVDGRARTTDVRTLVEPEPAPKPSRSRRPLVVGAVVLALAGALALLWPRDENTQEPATPAALAPEPSVGAPPEPEPEETAASEAQAPSEPEVATEPEVAAEPEPIAAPPPPARPPRAAPATRTPPKRRPPAATRPPTPDEAEPAPPAREKRKPETRREPLLFDGEDL